MYFEYTKILLLLVLLIPVFFLLRRSKTRAQNFARVYKANAPVKLYFLLKNIFVFTFLTSMIAVAARPYIESNQSGDFLFLVDVSRSMDARQTCGDLTFLERSKVVMRKILDEMPEARFGIVIFDRFAFPITQMTSDFEYLNEVIDEGIHIGMTFEATKTELANSLEVIADKKLRLPDIYGNVKKVILLSDGYVSGAYRRRFAEPLEKLRSNGISVSTVGVGNPSETPIIAVERDICTTQHIEMDGETVFIQLRDDVLKFIASESQGKYYSEGDTDTLITDIRSGLEFIETDNPTGQYRRDMSFLFMVTGSIGLFGMLLLGADIRPGIAKKQID
jgi:hypothetical protein